MTTSYTIDAANRTIGRVASEAASILVGKLDPSAVRNATTDVKVSIINSGKARITEKKAAEKEYVSYSGYPRGIKYRSLGVVTSTKGVRHAIRDAVLGMLPKNKLQQQMIKRLTVSE